MFKCECLCFKYFSLRKFHENNQTTDEWCAYRNAINNIVNNTENWAEVRCLIIVFWVIHYDNSYKKYYVIIQSDVEILTILFIHFLSRCVHMYTCVCLCVYVSNACHKVCVEVRWQLAAAGSLLLLCVSQRLNLSYSLGGKYSYLLSQFASPMDWFLNDTGNMLLTTTTTKNLQNNYLQKIFAHIKKTKAWVNTYMLIMFISLCVREVSFCLKSILLWILVSFLI